MKPVQKRINSIRPRELRDRQQNLDQRVDSQVLTHSQSDHYSSEDHGTDHRYGRPTTQLEASEVQPFTADQDGEQTHVYPEARRAKRMYQAAADLAHQRVTHAPFYFDHLGHPPPPSEPSQSREKSAPPPLPRPIRSKPTRFYPGGGPDRIEATARIGRAQLQRVLPNYELSTSETRTSGLGPKLESQ